jgi:hypothetical protein
MIPTFIRAFQADTVNLFDMFSTLRRGEALQIMHKGNDITIALNQDYFFEILSALSVAQSQVAYLTGERPSNLAPHVPYAEMKRRTSDAD